MKEKTKPKKKQDFPPPPDVFSTTDYDKFTMIDFNRDLKQSNCEKLEILNKQAFEMNNFPIVVFKNEKGKPYPIKDGQHRFIVCKDNGWPIYYIVDSRSKIEPRVIRRVNTAGKKHTIEDFINGEVITKSDEFVKANDIWKDMNGLLTGAKISRILVFRLLYSYVDDCDLRSVILDEEYKVNYQTETMRLFDFLSDLYDLTGNDSIFKDAFVLGFSRVVRLGRSQKKPIGESQIIERIKKNATRISICSSRDDNARMLVGVYNYLLSNRARRLSWEIK